MNLSLDEGNEGGKTPVDDWPKIEPPLRRLGGDIPHQLPKCLLGHIDHRWDVSKASPLLPPTAFALGPALAEGSSSCSPMGRVLLLGDALPNVPHHSCLFF